MNNNNSPILKLPFLSDRSWFEIKRTLNKYNKFKIQLIMEKRNTICRTVKPKENNQCSCDICKKLPGHLNCRSRFLVYSLICKLCTTSMMQYIGETCVWLKDRLYQHKYSIKNKDNRSALSQHLNCEHKGSMFNIDDFNLKILQQCKDSHDTCIAEAVWIGRLKPKINRKHELNDYNVDYM